MKQLLSLLLFASTLFGGYDEGVKLFKEKKYAEAVPHFKTVIELAPKSYQGYYMLALCYENLGKDLEALKVAEEGFAQVPDNLKLGLLYANLLLINKKPSKALEVLGKLPQQNLSKIPAYHRIAGSANLALKKYSEAMTHFQKVIQAKPDFGALYQGALAAYNAGAYTTATEWLEKALQKNPKDAQARYWYIQALTQSARRSPSAKLKKGLYEKAAEEAKKLAHMKGDVESNLLAGETLMGAKRYQEAIPFLEQAKSKSPKNGFAYLYLGQVLSSLERYEDSIVELKKAVPLLPSDKQKLAWRQLGYVYQKLYRFDEAISAYEKAGDTKKIAEAKDAKEKYLQNKKAEQEEQEYKKKQEELKKLKEKLKQLEGQS